MGQITDIKAGNRGCSFNDRFQFEAIESVTTDSTSNHGYHCLSNEEDENYLYKDIIYESEFEDEILYFLKKRSTRPSVSKSRWDPV